MMSTGSMFYIGFDSVIAMLLILAGIFFLVAKEKACSYISVYKLKSEAEKSQYNKKKMSRDFGIFYLFLGFLFSSSVFFDFYTLSYGDKIGFLCFLILIIGIFFTRSKYFDDRYKDITA